MTVGAGRRGALVLAAALALAGCAPARAELPSRLPSGSELRHVHARLAALREELGPRTEELQVTIEAPLLPGEIRARGAIAVVPGRAARMILVGPGGSTAIDLWMDRAGHRLAIPSRDEVVRGKRGEPARAMPIELLRAWFLEPLEGELLYAAVDPGGVRAVLRTDDAVVRVDVRDTGVLSLERVARRRPGVAVDEDVERIRADRGAGCGPVLYERPLLGLRASITCERRRSDVAERALVDPDREAQEAP